MLESGGGCPYNVVVPAAEPQCQQAMSDVQKQVLALNRVEKNRSVAEDGHMSRHMSRHLNKNIEGELIYFLEHHELHSW